MLTILRGPCSMLVTVLVLCASSDAWSLPPTGECPQPRFTGKAPDEYLALNNPLSGESQVVIAARRLYLGKDGGVGCVACHGKKGDGKGKLASQLVPRPRNFACAETVNGIPDGQLFWIIRFGSPGTGMPPHPDFSDEQVWQLVSYLRRLAK